MGDTKLADYPARLGGKQLVEVDHTGPASYPAGGETIGVTNNLTGITDQGLSTIDDIIGSGSFSVSGTYWVQAQPTGTGSRKTWLLTWNTNASSSTLVVVTPGASPYAYTAPQEGTVSISGGTVSAVTLTRGSATAVVAPVAGFIPVQQGDIVTITYSVVPTVNFIPSGASGEVAVGTNLSAETVRLGYLGR